MIGYFTDCQKYDMILNMKCSPITVFDVRQYFKKCVCEVGNTFRCQNDYR